MTVQPRPDCPPNPAPGCQPVTCWATFTIDGQRGQSQFPGGAVILQADDNQADTYQWDVISSPRGSRNLLTGALCAQARLLLPVPGAYIIQLTITRDDCYDQTQQTLWVTTPACWPPPPPNNEECDCCLSEADQAAIEDAVGTPNSDNPFVTWEQLERYLSEADRAAIKDAVGTPDSDNPFVTKDQLEIYLSPADRAAIKDASGTPNTDNPFLTRQELEAYLSAADRAAIKDAPGTPNSDNPFVTQNQLETFGQTHFLSKDDQEAIEYAEGHPNFENPFITKDQFENLKEKQLLSPDDKAAIEEAAGTPNRSNPFVTTEQWQPTAPSEDEKTALKGITDEHPPNADNPYATQEDLPVINLDDYVTIEAWQKTTPSEPQKEALDQANDPSQSNPFATHEDIAHIPPGDYVTRPEWAATAPSEAEKAALSGVNPTDHPPSNTNRYVTHDDLAPGVINPEADFVTRPEWLARAPSEDEKAALQGFNDDHPPGESNPYATREDIPQVNLDDYIKHGAWQNLIPSEPQKEALDQANDPSQSNPFATHEDIAHIPPGDYVTRPEWAATAPSEAEKAALSGANPTAHPPSDENRYVTHDDLAPGVINPEAEFVTRPEWLARAPSEDEKAALQGFNDDHPPSEKNPYATREDIPDDYVRREECGIWIVAAGQIDLKSAHQKRTFGGIRVIKKSPEDGYGKITLTFENYDANKKSDYVVNVLPINRRIGKGYQYDDLIAIQFVEFNDQGFVLQVARPFAHGGGLGVHGKDNRESWQCMVEVMEIVDVD